MKPYDILLSSDIACEVYLVRPAPNNTIEIVATFYDHAFARRVMGLLLRDEDVKEAAWAATQVAL